MYIYMCVCVYVCVQTHVDVFKNTPPEAQSSLFHARGCLQREQAWPAALALPPWVHAPAQSPVVHNGSVRVSERVLC